MNDLTTTNPIHHPYRRYVCTACGHHFDAPVWCHNRFCEVCYAQRATKIRHRLRQLVAATLLQPPWAFRHVVLTIPNVADPASGCTSLVHGFRRLRQRTFWKRLVRGGAYFVEITGTPGRWHVHLHIIAIAKWLPHTLLRTQWSDVSPGRITYIHRMPVGVIISTLTHYVTTSDLPERLRPIAADALASRRLYQCFGFWEGIHTYPLIQFPCPKCQAQGAWYPLDRLKYLGSSWWNVPIPEFVVGSWDHPGQLSAA